MLSFIKLFLMFLLVVVVCVTLKCQLKGGMALYQDSKRLDKDRNKCTFTSLIHAFTANRTLNRHVCKVLQERIDKRESTWKELLKILCTREYTLRITSPQQYLPRQIFRQPLQHILTTMKQDNLPKETYNLCHDTAISMDPRIGGWTELNIYDMLPYLFDSEYKYKGPLKYNVPIDVNGYAIHQSWVPQQTTLNAIKSFFLYAQIDFEAAFMGTTKHMVTITRTDPRTGPGNWYTYYDDYKGFRLFEGKRDQLLIYYLLVKIKSINYLLTITKSSKLTPNQYRIAEEKAQNWTNFFWRLNLQNVEFAYYGDISDDPLAEENLYYNLAIFITDEFRRYIDSSELSKVSSVKDEIKEIAAEHNFTILESVSDVDREEDRWDSSSVSYVDREKDRWDSVSVSVEYQSMNLKDIQELCRELGMTNEEEALVKGKQDYIRWIKNHQSTY